jgi:fatty acid desaturase
MRPLEEMALPLEGLRKFDPSESSTRPPYAPRPRTNAPPLRRTRYLRANKLPTFLVRGVYLACVVGTPFYHHHWATALAHIWFMSVVESLTLAVPFALSHNFEDSNRYPTAAGQQCWYRMQVETSSTYGGKIAGYLTGGLNFQIEHHLFPRMSSAW